MKNAGFSLATLLLVGANFAAVGGADFASENTSLLLNAKQIRAAMILWGGGAAGTVETITPALLDGRKTWRITHYSQDPTETRISDYDLYDLDQETLAPIRSVRNTEEYRLELVFRRNEVTLRKITGENTSIERIPLATAVQAEGPGLDVFVAGLPLQSGYKARYAIVDRWGGHDKGRVKTITLTVIRKSIEHTPLGRREIYEILIQPEDDSFRIKEKVLAESPHYPLRVEYTREGKTFPASEVLSLASRP